MQFGLLNTRCVSENAPFKEHFNCLFLKCDNRCSHYYRSSARSLRSPVPALLTALRRHFAISPTSLFAIVCTILSETLASPPFLSPNNSLAISSSSPVIILFAADRFVSGFPVLFLFIYSFIYLLSFYFILFYYGGRGSLLFSFYRFVFLIFWLIPLFRFTCFVYKFLLSDCFYASISFFFFSEILFRLFFHCMYLSVLWVFY